MSAESDFLENQKLLNIFFEYLKSSDPKLDEDVSDDAKKLFAIQKSSFILMLYNIIESTVSNLIQEIINLVVSYSSNIEFKDYNMEIRKLWIKLQSHRFSEINKAKKANELADLYESLYKPTNWGIYDIFKNSNKIRDALNTSGNLDFKKIQEIFENFNIKITPFQTQGNSKVETSTPKGFKSGKLGEIKKLRNSLAHGNVSFLKGSENVTIKELEEYKKATFGCLEILVNETKEYCHKLQIDLEEKSNKKKQMVKDLKNDD